MNRQLLMYLVIVLIAGASIREATAQEVVAVSLSQREIEEALRLASDEKAARKFLQSYVVQTRTGLGPGPLLGYFSTPFARIVLGSLAARKDGKTFASTDVTPDLLVPELHVLVLSQTAAYDPVPATIQAVTIRPRNSNSPDAEIQPLTIVAVTKEHYALYEVTQGNGATLASFPLTAVAAGNDIRVVFSHVVRGSSALTNCKDCAVPLGVTRIR